MTKDHLSDPRAAEVRPVEVGRTSSDQRRGLLELGQRAHAAAGDVRAALALARDHGARLPLPGDAGTALLWSALATVAAVDLTVARVLEPHLDAHAILAQAEEQAGGQPGDGTSPVQVIASSGNLDACSCSATRPAAPSCSTRCNTSCRRAQRSGSLGGRTSDRFSAQPSEALLRPIMRPRAARSKLNRRE